MTYGGSPSITGPQRPSNRPAEPAAPTDLKEWLEHPGWVIAKRTIESKADEMAKRISTYDYASLEALKGDQMMLRLLRKIANEPLEFFRPG